MPGPALRDFQQHPSDKLIQQAGRFSQVGKLAHALEPYLKAHQLNSGETTKSSFR